MSNRLYYLERTDAELRQIIAGCNRTIEDSGWHDNPTDAARARKTWHEVSDILKIPMLDRFVEAKEIRARQKRLDELLAKGDKDHTGPAF